MEYALGISVTATLTFLAIWLNDTFKLGGELSDEELGINELGVNELAPVTAGRQERSH